jgi:CRP/FNR family transcriptional regulator, nitrogen oxide reductase regulator
MTLRSGSTSRDTNLAVADTLYNSPLLSGLSQTEAFEVSKRATRKEWKADSWLYRQGDPATQFYVLESGRIKVLRTGTRGAETVMRFSAPGQVFGDAALIKKSAYLCSALAASQSRTLSWTTEIAWQLMRDYPRLSENVMQIFLAQLAHLQDRCLNLAGEAVERRLARSLSQLASSIGKKSGRATIISEGFSAKDLADLSGTTIFTVSRVLGEWERRGVLKKGRGWVAVLDSDALLQEAARSKGNSG